MIGFDEFRKRLKVILPAFKIFIPVILLENLAYYLVRKALPFSLEEVFLYLTSFSLNGGLLEFILGFFLSAVLFVVHLFILWGIPIYLTEWIYKKYYPDSEFTKRVVRD